MTARRALAVAGLVAFGAGCDDAVPGSVLAGPRVIAIVADPPVVALDGVAQLTAILAVDGAPAAPERIAWRACSPATVVVDPERDCVGAAALPLPVDAAGAATFDPAAVVARFGPPAGLAGGGDPADDPCGRGVVAMKVVLAAELAGARLVATKDVRVGVAPPPRTNPAFAQVVIAGAAVADGAVLPVGTTVELTADLAVDHLDRVCEDGGVDPVAYESVDVSVVAGGGAAVSPRTFGVDHAPDGAATAGMIDLDVPGEPGPFPVWLVAVDPDGGVAVARRQLAAR